MSATSRGARILISGIAGDVLEAYADRAISEGAESVTLWGGNSRELSGLVAALGERARGRTRVSSYLVDLADLGSIAKTAHKTRREAGNPDVLINAGSTRVEPFQCFWDVENGDARRTMMLTALAPMYVAREFLPGMIHNAYRPARIVNIAATALDSGGTSIDAAAESSLMAWSESLRQELLGFDHSNVKVTTVSSRSSHRIAPQLLKRLSGGNPDPRDLVDRTWRAMLAGRRLVTV